MLQIWDCMAERGEFELPVPISEQPDGNMMSGPRCPNEVSGSSEAQARGRLIRSATFEGDLHSYAMNDVATDVAAAIQMKGEAILPGHSPSDPKSAREMRSGAIALCSSSRCRKATPMLSSDCSQIGTGSSNSPRKSARRFVATRR